MSTNCTVQVAGCDLIISEGTYYYYHPNRLRCARFRDHKINVSDLTSPVIYIQVSVCLVDIGYLEDKSSTWYCLKILRQLS